MSGFRSSIVLFALAAPFAAYAAWQARGVMRTDLVLSDPPAEKSATQEQLAATRAKSERWSNDVRKAAAVVLQFRPPGADDTTSDEDCTALARAAAKRAADLADLETFLSGRESPDYTGTLRAKYLEWQSSKASLAKSEKAVEEWFVKPLAAIDSSDAAAKTLDSFNSLVADYAKDVRFSDPAKIVAWKVRARIEVMSALESAAEAPYARVLELPLPLPSEANSADVQKALGAPRALREQVKLLQTELTGAEDAKRILPARVLADAKLALKRADEWAARERVLVLFAEPTIFTNATGAAEWLGRVNAQFDRTTATEDRLLLRRKVQEFCEAFIPAAVLLDDAVLIDGKRVARSQVEVKYFPASGGGSRRARLTADPNGKALTEFTLAEKHPGDDTLVLVGATEYYPKQLKPTESSKAAFVFLESRRELVAGSGTLKWTAKTIEELKNKCKPHAVEINRLVVPNGKTETAPEIWNRLESLSKGAELCRQLFEKGQ